MNKMITKQEVERIKTRAKSGQYREALQKLAVAKGDMFSPYDVLDAARDTKSPLHGAFTWNDGEAGEKYRLMEARLLISQVSVEFMGAKRPAFYNTRVVLHGKQQQAYFPVERVMTDADIHAAVLRDAVRDLKHSQEKYSQLQELEGVINERKLKKIEKQLQG